MALDKAEKIGLVNDLVDSVKAKIIDAIKNGKIPDDWDGHELRRLIADRFGEVAYIKMDRRRLKDYKNVVLTQNLDY